VTGALEGFAVIGALIAVGYLLAATRVLDESSQVVLARLVYYVATPALLIEILGSTDLGTVFGPWFLVAVIGVVAVLLVYVPWARWQGHSGKHVVVGGLASSFANSGYLGLPIAAYVAGDVAFALPTIMLQLMVMTPVAVTLLSMEEGRRATPLGFVRAGLSNPVSIAAIVGVVLSLAHVDLPRFVDEPISLLGAMAIPSAVLAFGVALRFGPRIGHGNRREVAFVTVLKILWQPLVTYLVARHGLGLSAYEVAGVTVMAALPTAQSVFVYAAQFGRGEVLARDSVVITTLVSLPVMVLLAALLVP
jgi:malonate transporter